MLLATNQIRFKLLVVVVLTLVLLLLVMLPVGAAQAGIRSNKSWRFAEVVLYEGVPFFFIYTVHSSVKGVELIIRRVYVSEYSCSGAIKNYYGIDWWGNLVPAYPFDIRVIVNRGKFIDGRNVVLTFDNRDLSPYHILRPLRDRWWWGGKMFPNIYVWKNTTNRVWVSTGWIATSTGHVLGAGVNDVNHIF